MRVEGVALATAISHYCGLLITLPMVVSAIRNITPFSFLPLNIILNFAAMRRYLGLGFDLTIRTSCIILSELIVLNAASAIDDVSLAASQIGFVIFATIAYPLDGFAHAAEALTGSAIGRRSHVMFNHTLRETTNLAIIMSVIMAILLALFGDVFIGAMTSIPAVVERSHQLLPILVVMPVVSVIAFQMDGVFVGATMGRDMRNAMLISMLVFLPLMYVMEIWLGLIGIWLAFMLLLGLRGATLWMRLNHIRVIIE
jgi:MATE family multidrug resistance protein